MPFYLLADTEHKAAEAYGAWGEKKLYGKTYMGMLRITYVIDEEGKILRVFPKVKPENHGREVLETIKVG